MLIHIGFHKTGTTYLQHHVFQNRENHFVAPWTLKTGEAVQHFVLTHPARFDAAAVRAAFLAKTTGENQALVPVISHEDLCGYPIFSRYYGHEVARRIHETFPEAKILITVREQKSALRSLYGEYVRQGGQWPIKTFLGAGQEQPGYAPICRLDHLEYDLLVDRYATLFGGEQVLVLPFEILKSDPRKFQQTVQEFAGAKSDGERDYAREYAGFGALSLRLMRALNKVAPQPPDWNGEWLKFPIRVRAKIKLCETLDRFIPKHWHRSEEDRLTAFINSRTAGYFGPGNQRLQKLCSFDLASLGYEI